MYSNSMYNAESGAHKGARVHVTIFQLTNYVAILKILLVTFAIKNLACCPVGLKIETA